jgi:hypothetical protein
LVPAVRAAQDCLKVMLVGTTVGTLRPSPLLQLAAVAAAFLQMVFPIQVVPTVDRVAEVEISMEQVVSGTVAGPASKEIAVEEQLAPLATAAVVVAAAAPVVPVLME